MSDSISTWIHRVRCYWRTQNDAAIVGAAVIAMEMPERGNVMHAVWTWNRANRPYPPCDICGGPVDPRAKRHELCRARRERGLPIQTLDQQPQCGCSMCR